MNDPGDSTIVAPSPDEASDSEPPERLSISILSEAGDWSAFASHDRAIKSVAAALASHPGCQSARGAEASVVLGDDAFVRSLNKTYRSKDRPTNVLSFPFQAPPGAGRHRILGDVVLAGETVLSEARQRGIPSVHHLQHLVAHGLLHLLGFDHETDAEAEAMERLETEILAAVGVPDPHASAVTV